MQTTSETWKALLATDARLEAQVSIGGVEYTEMSNPVITRAVMQDKLSIGNAVSANCTLAVLTDDVIPRAAEVKVKMRLTDGTTTSEWLPAGTFYIAKRQRDPVTGVLTLECYDAMLKANVVLDEVPWTTDTGEPVTTEIGEMITFSAMFPRDPMELVKDIALLLGITVDSRTSLKSDSSYIVEAPTDGTTIHDVLCLIAAQNGGNWIITPDNKLRLVPLVSAAEAAEAEENVIDVTGITGSIEQRTTTTVTGIRYASTDESSVVLGDETGLVINTDLGAAIASDLYDELVGISHQTYTVAGAIYDPAAELGDYVRAGVNGEVSSVLYSETATLGALFHGILSAPEGGELADEYPYLGSASAKALTAAKVYAAKAVAALDSSLNQESVFNRLTDNGAAQGLYMVDGQLYVNMSYARAGTLVLGGLNNKNGLLQVQDSNGNVVGSWDKDGVSIVRGALNLPVDSSQNNIIMINGVDDVASYRRAFLIKYQQGSNRPIRTTLDRGEINIMSAGNNSSVSYGAVSIKPGKIVVSSDNAWDTVLVLLDGTSVYYVGSSMTSGTAKLYLYDDRIYMTYRNARTGSDVTWFDLDVFMQTMRLEGEASFKSVSCDNGASGTFTTANGQTVTVSNGIITSIA